MRIGVNTLFLIPKEVGGTETPLRELLDSIHNRFPDVTLHLFTNLENDASFRSQFRHTDRIEFTTLKFHARNRYVRILREQFELPLRVKQAKIDVLWSPGYTTPAFLSCPQVVLIHDLQYKKHPEDFGFLERFVFSRLVSMASKSASLVLTPSEFSKKEIMKHFGASENHVWVSRWAAKSNFSQLISAQEKNETLRKLMPDEKPYLLCVANTYPHKNVSFLVRAFKLLLNKIPHRLVLVGQARRGEPALKKALSEIPNGRFLRLHYVADSELTAVYQNAEAFILPSLYEGFGLPVIEAMMSGIPVLATRRASLPEILGEAGIYFDESNESDLAQKIERIVSLSPNERQKIGERLQARAREFSWESTAERILNCFRSALNSKQPQVTRS